MLRAFRQQGLKAPLGLRLCGTAEAGALIYEPRLSRPISTATPAYLLGAALILKGVLPYRLTNPPFQVNLPDSCFTRRAMLAAFGI